MKKLLVLMLAFASVFTLVACGNKDEEVVDNENVADNFENTKSEENVAKNDVVSEFSEYQFNLNVVIAGGESEQSIDMDVFKKGDKMLYVVNKFGVQEEMPFTPKKSLIIGSDMYTNIEMNGESMRFKAEGAGMDMGSFFDLEGMQAEFADAETVEKETIDGKKMTCYYKDGGKGCTYDGVFTYGEGVDPNTGEKSVIKISNYKTSVKDNVFETPKDVKSMEDMMQLMMGAVATGDVVLE